MAQHTAAAGAPEVIQVLAEARFFSQSEGDLPQPVSVTRPGDSDRSWRVSIGDFADGGIQFTGGEPKPHGAVAAAFRESRRSRLRRSSGLGRPARAMHIRPRRVAVSFVAW
jgi:hypothetical protein